MVQRYEKEVVFYFLVRFRYVFSTVLTANHASTLTGVYYA